MSDSIVKCLTCGKEERVKFGFCLFKGWPRCCGYTMRLMKTDADIDNAVSSGAKKYSTITIRLHQEHRTGVNPQRRGDKRCLRDFVVG